MDIQQSVQEAYSAWDREFNEANANSLAAFYAEDAIFLPATHDVIRGRSGVSKFFQGIFGMGVTGHKLEIIEARGQDRFVYAAAKWSANGKGSTGEDQPWGGVATHVFERQPDGSLQLKLHTFN